VLPITTVRLIIYLVKITVQFSRLGRLFFCGLTAIGTNRISKTKWDKKTTNHHKKTPRAPTRVGFSMKERLNY